MYADESGGTGDHAGLGILPRCEWRNADRAAELIEFCILTVDPVPDPAQFTAPPGSIIGDRHGRLFGGSFTGLGWEIAKTTAGLAVGGLGAAIRYSPFGPLRRRARCRAMATPGRRCRTTMLPQAMSQTGPPVSDEVFTCFGRTTKNTSAVLHVTC
jgi:hypothetical protein